LKNLAVNYFYGDGPIYSQYSNFTDITCLYFIYDKENSAKGGILVIFFKYSKFNKIRSKNSLCHEVLSKHYLYWIYLNFNDIYANTLLFQENVKIIKYI
jgi:hypothetical protein